MLVLEEHLMVGEILDLYEISSFVELKEYSKNEIAHSIKVLNDYGYIDCEFKKYITGSIDCLVSDITNTGHEFINQIRNDTTWNKLKPKLGKAGVFTLDFIKDVAAAAISSRLK